jgi:hypothetical protein
MAGKPRGKVALTPTERQRRWREKKRRQFRHAAHRDPASLRTSRARPDDSEFWPTPPCLRAALTSRVFPSLPAGTIWEAAAGDGYLSAHIEAATGRTVISTDIDPQRQGIGRHDFHNPPSREMAGSILVTNPPWSAERLDRYIARALALLDSEHLRGVVLLLRADHMGAGSRAAIFNRAAAIWTCCWRPRWIPGTTIGGRWWCVWVLWLAERRGPPVNYYLTPNELRAAGVWPSRR